MGNQPSHDVVHRRTFENPSSFEFSYNDTMQFSPLRILVSRSNDTLYSKHINIEKIRENFGLKCFCC
jgi:hypothetical protein